MGLDLFYLVSLTAARFALAICLAVQPAASIAARVVALSARSWSGARIARTSARVRAVVVFMRRSDLN